MNKGDMIEQLAANTNLPKTQIKNIVDQIFDAEGGVIANALKNGEKVSIPGFGTFEPRKREARTGRNPQTGATINIAASTTPAFKAGKTMKDSLNQ